MIKKFKELNRKQLVILNVMLLILLLINMLFLQSTMQRNDEGYSYINPGSYIELADYKNLEYEQGSIDISEEDIDAEIDARRNEAATSQSVKEGTVENGDVIVIDYEGTIDGKAFDGNKGTDKKITIGSGTFIDGLEESLIGEEVGGTAKVTLTFPEDYDQSNVAGKTVDYEVKIKTKEETVPPKYDKDFIQTDSKGKYTKKKDYEEYIKNYLIKKQQKQIKQKAKDNLWQQVVSNTKVKSYPEKQLAKEEKQILKQHKALAEQYNVSWEDFLVQYLGTNEKDFKKRLKTTAKAAVKEKLIVLAISREEGISVSDEEYKDSLKQVLKESGLTEAEFAKEYKMTLEEYAREYDIKNTITQSKVIDQIFKYAKPAKAAKDTSDTEKAKDVKDTPSTEEPNTEEVDDVNNAEETETPEVSGNVQ